MFSVYLVDDEALALEDMARRIRWAENGFEIVGKSTDPAAAVREIVALRPDAVFTDLRMPGLDGIELIHAVQEAYAEAYFIVVTAHRDFESMRHLLHLNGFDYLIKPATESGFEPVFMRLHAALQRRRAKSAKPPSSCEELNRILAYIDAHFTQKLSLQQLGEVFTIHPNAICNLFSKHLGTTFVRHITALRMQKAARMLREGACSVKEIALECGYEDYFYFCRIFRQHFSCTPTNYRKGEGGELP